MSYTWLAVVTVALGMLVDLLVLRTNVLRHKAFWTAYVIMLFFQLVTNGLLTGLPIVRYAPDRVVGWHVVYAPVEDLLFGFALILVTLSIWVRLGRLSRRAGSATLHANRQD